MNTKKITALALAALMAAGSTATAFAVNKVDGPATTDKDRPLSFEDAAIYEESDGVLKESNDFRPGDTLYIRLKEDSSTDKKIEDKKDDMKVYADWKVGKDAVKSIDIVYRKGNYNSSMSATTYTFTVDGVPFVIKGADITTNLNDAIKAELVRYQAAHPDFLKDEIANQMNTYAKTKYAYTSGVTTQNYDTAKEALQAAGWTYGTYYAHATKAYENTDVVNLLKAAGGDNTNATSKYYSANEEKTAGFGTYLDADTNGAGALGANCYMFSTDTKFVDSDVITTVEALMGTNVVSGIEKKEDVFKKGDKLLTEAEAVADEASVKAVTVYAEGSTDLTLEEAKAKAVAGAIANEVVNASGSVGRTYKDNYTYWVEIKTKEDDTTKVLDLAGVLRIGSTKNKAEDAANTFRLDTSLDNRVYDNGAYVKVVDEWTFKPDSRSVVKFDDDADDVTLYFGENEAAWFEFDARGQSALNLEFTFDFNKEIADLFPKANIDFLTFTSKPSTNRTGELYITADEDTFLYEVTEDGVKEIPNAEYSEKEGAWHIRTRKLGAYAISDTELDTSVKVNGKDEASSKPNTSKPNGGKNNPDTGR